ncbi:PREDICTED: SH2 domain-containing protein 4A [Gekko japonicus]|uniref:SH2 domain-containing protein 4A n=1 Tax=Gekko japonicus TaxID=146911 RepID=A0ABM1JMN9_GEKJA|nr:PREDICTED: SH2 domain-containing protein 4A [Gekko japonicus]
MLRQILSEMRVAPELLAELSEEQKQILFFKMRQEQVRRWRHREEEEEAQEAGEEEASRRRRRRSPGKSVHWKLGADGDVWVWVMGEHPLDKPYDLLCDEERRRRSLPEAEALRRLGEAFTEPSVTSPETKLTSGVEGVRENFMEQEMLKGVRQAPAAGSAPNQDGTQTAVSKARSVEEMLADSISHSRKQRKDAQMRSATSQSQAQGEAPPNLAGKSTQNADKEDPVWLESLRRSKAADERRRSLAKHARDDYKRLSLQGKNKGKAADVSRTCKTGEQRRVLPPAPPLPPKPKTLPPSARLANGPPAWKPGVQRSASTSTQESIVQWFKAEQLPLRAGFEKAADQVAPWFHGILTTKEAEELLSHSVPGTFLIRVSEKIQGYVLSYLSAEGCKHFLIDASGESYSFLGVDQLQHSTLADLVEYHKDEPITSLGKELLFFPCGQQGQEPDYLDLFQ